MSKSSVLGSLAFVPFLLVACGSDGSTDGPSGGTGGVSAAGANSGGTSGAHAGSSGSSGTSTSNAGDNSVAGESMGGMEDMAGAAGDAGSAGSGDTGGASGGHGGSGGTSGSSGSAGNGGASAGAGGGTACTTAAQCASTQVCIASVCTPCDAVTFSSGSTVYFVDPANGNDSNGTGSAKSGGQAANACAFKTITRALQVIGSPTQASGAVVKLKGNVGAATGETFPISVPQYVVIQGLTAPVTVTLAAGKSGFNFVGTGSTLKDLILEGGGI